MSRRQSLWAAWLMVLVPLVFGLVLLLGKPHAVVALSVVVVAMAGFLCLALGAMWLCVLLADTQEGDDFAKPQDAQEAQFAPLEPQGARSAAFPSGVGIWE